MLELLKNAPKRFIKSFGYCRAALMVTFCKEESFRLEIIGLVVLIVALVVSPWPGWKCWAMLACYLVIPLVEVLNSAIEDICDLISKEHNQYIKNAKDKGALAVLGAIVFNALALIALLAMPN